MCYMALSASTKILRFSIQFKALFGIKPIFLEIMIMATLKIHVKYSILIDITEAYFTYVLFQTFKEINVF